MRMTRVQKSTGDIMKDDVVFVSQDENKWYVQNSFQMLDGEYIACFQIEREADEYARYLNRKLN